jgi:hypothetical protein
MKALVPDLTARIEESREEPFILVRATKQD